MDSIHPLRRWRLGNGITLAGLAARKDVGVTASHLSEIERGLNAPSANLTAKLSRATGGKVSNDEIVEWATRRRPQRRRAA